LFPTGFRERLKAFTADSSEVFAAGAFQVIGSTVTDSTAAATSTVTDSMVVGSAVVGSTVTDSMLAGSMAADSTVAVIINPVLKINAPHSRLCAFVALVLD
jgi:hypothetical protein